MSYDANGNMSASGFNGPETFNYDVENRLVHNRQLDGFGLKDDYVDDGAGNLVRRRATSWSYPGAVDQKNLYVDGLYEEYSNFCDAPASITKFYMAFGRIIARSGFVYLLADHLGSTVGAIDGRGGTYLNKYYPFGGQRGASESYGAKAFTGQQKEFTITSSLNAYYFHARFYSPDLGHFLSADPIAKDGLNRYAYVLNSPTNAVDPTGLYLLGACGWRQNCDNGLKGFGDWRNTVIQYWKSSGRFGDANLDDVFNLFQGAKWSHFKDAELVNIFDADVVDSSHLTRETHVDGSARMLSDLIDRIPGNVTYLVGFSFGGSTINEYLYGVSRGIFSSSHLDLRGVYFVGAPQTACRGPSTTPMRRGCWPRSTSLMYASIPTP